MNLTLSVIKAAVGRVGGIGRPSQAALDTLRRRLEAERGRSIIDVQVRATGGGITALLTHRRGLGCELVHKLAWDGFAAATRTARQQGLSGVPELLQDAFADSRRVLQPMVAEMDIEERAAEPMLLFDTDQADASTFNLPLYLAFADPLHSPSWLQTLDGAGFDFQVAERGHPERLIELSTPADLYLLARLLRDAERYQLVAVRTRAGEPAAAVGRPLPSAVGTVAAAADPVLLLRVHAPFPLPGEVLAPIAETPCLGGAAAAAILPLMPVSLGEAGSDGFGPPIVTCAAFSVHEGRLSDVENVFAQPHWQPVRERAARLAAALRRPLNQRPMAALPEALQACVEARLAARPESNAPLLARVV